MISYLCGKQGTVRLHHEQIQQITVSRGILGKGAMSLSKWVAIHDKGALDFVIRSRMQCAVCRAAEGKYDWGKEDPNG